MSAIPMLGGEQQFFDNNGVPLAGGFLATYAVGGLTPKASYQDFAASVLNANPIPLDSAGRCILWGNGRYRLILTDTNGNEIWDKETVGEIDVNTTATVGIPFIIDGSGSAILAGVKGDVMIPFAATITANTMMADQAGSIQVDIWKAAFSAFPPTQANSICGSDLPTITNAISSQDSGLAGWTTTVNAGDTLRFNVPAGATNITRVTIELTMTKVL